jgi:hypothetical protein
MTARPVRHPSMKRPRSVRVGTAEGLWKDHESAVPQPPESHLHYRNGEETIASRVGCHLRRRIDTLFRQAGVDLDAAK